LAIPSLGLTQSLAAQEVASEAAPTRDDSAAVWAFQTSDLPVDPAFVFGQLDNGMRFILRENATPEGTALVRLYVGAGSLDETDQERGLAHFLEHMAFNGTTNIPEGEMVKLLEREGLAFGADTNASTGFDATTYMLNLPRNDEDLLDTALMLMRETASEITIAPDAVERERGIILAERRDRRNYSYKETEDRLAFTAPGARFVDRLPIGTLETIESATSEDLRGFYERNYVPANTVLVIVGDFPTDLMERKIRERFESWRSGSMPPEPVTGPVDVKRTSSTDIYVDPALNERVTITRQSLWIERPDTIANRKASVLQSIGYGIINRRLAAIARSEGAPFRSAGFGTSSVFEDARSTNIVVDTADGEWSEGVKAAVAEVRRALWFGFTETEIAEQIARLRTSLENSVRASETRSNGALVGAALNLVASESVPTTPESGLARFESYVDEITPQAALAAVRDDAIDLTDPLIRFRGRIAPAGGEVALRSAWNEALAIELTPPQDNGPVSFAYTDFGPAGRIISDSTDDRFDFRLVTFANGVKLNLKQSDIRKNQVRFALTLDGGSLLNTVEDPLKTALASSLTLGGLGKHSQDELETILAGRDVRLSFRSSSDHFRLGGTTSPDDLELQMQLLAAALTDPGYRKEGEERYARSVENWFASLDATPAGALNRRIGAILSDNNPRFSVQPKEAYLARNFEKLREDIGDRLANGAIELALVGDFDPDAAIAAVAKTLAALPARETEFQTRAEARTRSFTKQRGLIELTHNGEPDQALVRLTWPTTDDSDLSETLRLALLNRVVRIKLQEGLREALGQAYSPTSSSNPSGVYEGYGTFALAASVDVAEIELTRAAIKMMLGDLRENGINKDLLNRARQPVLETYDNLLKSLGGWMSLADNAQSEADRLERFFAAPAVITSITPAEILETARRYLDPEMAVEIVVVPAASTTIAAGEEGPKKEKGPAA